MGTLNVNTIADAGGGNSVNIKGVGTTDSSLDQGLIKCFAVLDGRSTPSFYKSHNSSSISDQGTGDYRLVFTNGFTDKNYCAISGHEHTVSDSGCNAPVSQSDGTHTTAQARIQCIENGAARDPIFHNTIILGDLA